MRKYDYAFCYDDVFLRPNYSELESRSLGDTSVMFLGKKYELPVIPANMMDVISCENALFLAKNNFPYIFHRFGNLTSHFVSWFYDEGTRFSDGPLNISVGVNDESKSLLDGLWGKYGKGAIHNICIDVAHGHHNKVKDMVNFIRNNNNVSFIIAGNVATADGYKFLCDSGADAVKVGIGGGSICSTKYKTGFHLPTAYSVWECAKEVDYDIPIIADGGATHFGDIAKALVLGATMVMSGRWFAECIDSPAKISHGKKIYRGSTSYESKGHNNHIEGHTIEIEEGCTYKDRLKEIKQALQSSISYAGGKDLSAFNQVEWCLKK